MKYLAEGILVLTVSILLLSQCANPKAPTGGPMDSIPPVLVDAIPPAGTLFMKSQEITLIFDEWITAEKLSQNLIITPRIEGKYKTIVKKNELTLRFEEPFPDSTTITLNFFDGITDITEKTAAVNLSYVFSTGSYLDSLSLSGSLFNLYSHQTQEKYLVALYAHTDSLNIFTAKPNYFTSTNKQGKFDINNIKNGPYRFLAFNDQNRNQIFDASAEAYGFLSEIIQIDSNIQNLSIPVIKQNADSLRIMSSRANGQYYDVRYSKPLADIIVDTTYAHHLLKDKTTLRIYQPENIAAGDSTSLVVTAQDSLGTKKTDTLFVKFTENVRKPEKPTTTLTTNSKVVGKEIQLTIKFSKPITTYDYSGILWKKDSTFTQPLDSLSSLTWNRTKDQLQIQTTFDTTAYFDFQRRQIATDTLHTDTTAQRKPAKQTGIQRKIQLAIPANTFITVENDTVSAIIQDYTFLQRTETATLILTFKGADTPLTVQLIDKKFLTVYEYPYQPNMKLTGLLPAEYSVRLLFDDNGDGQWSEGNIRQGKEPEKTFVFKEFTSLRANWEVSLNINF